MQGAWGARGNFNRPTNQFDGFGFQGSFPSVFEGKDPFDDPFFTQSFSGLYGPSMFSTNAHSNLEHRSRSRGPMIEEIDSDDEREPGEHEKDEINYAAWRNRNPLVEHPEDQDNDDERSNNHKHILYRTNPNELEETQPHTQSVSFQRVTYGGINGAYRTATITRRTGGDGVSLEERKHADRTTGQATHRISRGINDTGHSVTRTLDSNGKVDTTQTLHNLNEDELASFERAWKGNTDGDLHCWNGGFDFFKSAGDSGSSHGLLTSWEGFPDPFKEHSIRNRGQSLDNNFQSQSSQGRSKKVVTINIE